MNCICLVYDLLVFEGVFLSHEPPPQQVVYQAYTPCGHVNLY